MTDDTTTIEAIDLAAYDWAPCCEVFVVVHYPDGDETTHCEQPATHVIEVRHCTPYRLFACTTCIHGRTPNGWVCRVCGGSYPSPVVIGKVA